MPLDLSDDQILAEPSELDQIRSTLTEHGWSSQGNYSSSTWARLRYIFSLLREELLEYLWRPLQLDDSNIKLRSVGTRREA